MDKNSTAVKKRVRRSLVLGCLAALVFGLAVAGWVIQSRDGNGLFAGTPAADPLATNRLPAVVAIGTVDVEGGVVSLLPLRSGRVEEVLVRENQTVQKGAVLLRLDDRLAKFEVQEAEAAVQAADAQLVDARKAPRQHELLLEQQRDALAAVQHELEAARRLAVRRDKLVEGRFLSKEEAEADVERIKKLEAVQSAERAKLAALELQEPQQQVARAQADLLSKQALLGKAHYALEEHQLRAASSGLVLRVLANTGELLGPQARQPAFLFCPDKPRIVRVELEQEFASRVRVGQQAVIEADAGGAAGSWKGRVVRVSGWFAPRRSALPDILPVQEARTLECVVQIDSGPEPVRIGQRMRVTFSGE
jgi:HlyD family secretion protein